MRRVAALLLAIGAIGTGCASAPPRAAVGPAGRPDRAAPVAQAADDDAVPAAATAPAGASALVFRAPMTAGEPPLDLARGPRQPSAFVGFEEPITEYYHVLTIDRQVSGGGWGQSFGLGRGWDGGYLDRYDRRAVTEKVGVLHR